MTILQAPSILIFDWHGTLVDTNDAMYGAMDDMLSGIDGLGLEGRLTATTGSKTADDRKLVDYVRAHHRLHPKVIADRRASRTDLLEVLFGADEDAKEIANRAYNDCYRRRFGDVKAFAPGVVDLLSELRNLGIRLGILTNRAREFLDKELETIEQGAWMRFFETRVSGSDTEHLKPSPDPVLRALQHFGQFPGPHVWYVGDSASDTISAKTAGITNVFFNGSQGDAQWIEAIFPGTASQPYQPDCVVNDYQGLLHLVQQAITREAAVVTDAAHA